jgi:hypothetical protein
VKSTNSISEIGFRRRTIYQIAVLSKGGFIEIEAAAFQGCLTAA